MFRLALIALLTCACASAQLGLFEGQTDVGTVLHPGGARYDPKTNTYVVSGSGENMWFAADDFHFVWKTISAQDLTLTADVSILGTGGDGHRKAVLMIRQSLDSDSAYVDAARHGDGLTSLQFRETRGGTTREVESDVSGPARLRIEKQGNRFYMWIATDNQDLQFAGGSAKVEMHAPFYVGIGVCAHNKDAVQEVSFANVELATKIDDPPANYSTVETVLESGDARVGYVSRQRLTSPGWSADGHALTFEVDGKRQEVPFTPLRTAAPIGAPLTEAASKTVQLKTLSNDGDVELQMLSLPDKKVKTLARFVGGEGSLGPTPWSPDGRRAVFISYQAIQ